MIIQAKLCHIDANRCVVKVSAWKNEQNLGSSLGEGPTVEEAEDQAIKRLTKRLNVEQEPDRPKPPKKAIQTAQPIQANPPVTVQDSAPKEEPLAIVNQESKDESPTEPDPEDWSDELAAIDLELQRIGWDRDREQGYLLRAFGHTSRNRLTSYSDIAAYLRQLKNLKQGENANEASIPIRRVDLLNNTNQVMNKLNWTEQQGRAFLKEKLQASSRQQLSDQQLINFNDLLEKQFASQMDGSSDSDSADKVSTRIKL